MKIIASIIVVLLLLSGGALWFLANGSLNEYIKSQIEMTLDINLESLTSSPIIIDAIVIKSPEAFVQFTQTGGSNIQDILDAIERNTPKTETTVEAPASDSKEPKVKVSKIILAGTALTLDLSAFGNKEHNATLPDITLNNVGGDAGLPASQLGSEIVKQALSTIWQQAKATQKKKLIDNAKDKLKEKAKKKLTDLFG